MKKKKKSLNPQINLNERLDFNSSKARRVFLLTNHCIANIAAYRVNWQQNENSKEIVIDLDFWVRANGNFLDIAVLEWCKLFAERDGKHHWSKVFKNRQEWSQLFLAHMNLSSKQFHKELSKIKKYRDRYVAHLDDPIPTNYPLTEIMLTSASYLYDALRYDPTTKNYLIGVYDSSAQFYERKFIEYSEEIRLRKSNMY